MGENKGKCIIILQKIDGPVIRAKNRRYSDIKKWNCAHLPEVIKLKVLKSKPHAN